jgi:diguanylate cyclase (GGDEF)-like protein
MQRLAFRDMLTDLPNRTSLQSDLELAWDRWRDHATPFALVMMDLDGFKPINDTHGHDVGDAVLKVVGARLLQLNRAHDLAARLGGDEFVIVLHNCTTATYAAQVAQRLIDTVSQPIAVKSTGLTVKVGASAGVAHVSDRSPDVETLLKHADTALYAAKAAGKRQVQVFAHRLPVEAQTIA